MIGLNPAAVQPSQIQASAIDAVYALIALIADPVASKARLDELKAAATARLEELKAIQEQLEKQHAEHITFHDKALKELSEREQAAAEREARHAADVIAKNKDIAASVAKLNAQRAELEQRIAVHAKNEAEYQARVDRLRDAVRDSR